jgi:hypothetical protein
MCKHLIKIAMDDLRDVGMISDYAKEAKGTEWESFFATRARQRMKEYEEDREWLRRAMVNDKEHAWHHMESYLDEQAEHLRWNMGIR